MKRALACLAVLAVLAAARPGSAAQPQFWKLEGAREFLAGEIKGLSVDSQGRMSLAPVSRLLHNPEAPYIWALARDDKGGVYAGSGNDGKVFRIEGDKGTLFFDAPELEVHAVAVGADGHLYVGTSPEGKVWRVAREGGTAEPFYDPQDKYIWSLAFDREGNLLVATGSEGRIYRVDKQGRSQVLLSSPETHVTTLVVDPSGNVYAGSSPEGIVYRLDAAGKVFVLHDAAYREVKALALGADGSLYAAVVEGKEKEDRTSPPPALPPMGPPGAPTGEVTVTEAYAIAPTAGPPSPAPVGRPSEVRTGALKGALLRIAPSGEVDTLWSSTEETPHSMLATPQGVLIGTGDKGQVYRIKDDRTWSMVATFPAEQVTALHRAGDAVLLATSNPAKLHTLEGTAGTSGSFVSKVHDTDTVSSWGRIRWQASLPSGTRIVIHTRSGNTGNPDATWSDWSSAYARGEGESVVSERARFLQVKATLEGAGGASPVLDSVTVAYLQRNLRPQVQSVTVHPPGEIFQKPLSLTGEVEILGLDTTISLEGRPGGPGAARAAPPIPLTSYSRKLYQKGIQTLSWKAEDANGDTLSYDVHYRRVGDTRYRILRKGLEDAVLAWDTSTVPNGRYVVKITASDAPANPEKLALAADKESEPFDVDNTPPVVSASLGQNSPLRIRVVVRDDSSLVRRTEYSIDGGRWEEVHPLDGINDALEESYEIAPPPLNEPGPHVIVVRATDLLGNVSTARVEIP